MQVHSGLSSSYCVSWESKLLSSGGLVSTACQGPFQRRWRALLGLLSSSWRYQVAISEAYVCLLGVAARRWLQRIRCQEVSLSVKQSRWTSLVMGVEGRWGVEQEAANKKTSWGEVADGELLNVVKCRNRKVSGHNDSGTGTVHRPQHLSPPDVSAVVPSF